MAGLQELGMEIYIVLLCLNSGIIIVDYLQDTPLVTPFDVDVPVSGLNNTSIYNPNSLVANVTTNVLNDTDSALLNPLQDFFFFPLQVLWTIIQFITGGFVFDVLTIFGFPAIIVIVLKTLVGFLLVRTIAYYFTGR
jgi:hypothetical protein